MYGDPRLLEHRSHSSRLAPGSCPLDSSASAVRRDMAGPDASTPGLQASSAITRGGFSSAWRLLAEINELRAKRGKLPTGRRDNCREPRSRQMPAFQRRRPRTVRSVGSLLLPHG